MSRDPERLKVLRPTYQLSRAQIMGVSSHCWCTICSVPWNMAEPKPTIMTPMNCMWKRHSKPCLMDCRRP